MWRIIKRVLKSAILMSIGIAFAKGTYEEGPEPELLSTPYTDPAMEALQNLAGTTPTLPGVTLPDYPTLPSYPTLPGVTLPGYPTLPDFPTLPGVNLPGMTGQESQLLKQGMGLIQQLMSGEMPEAFQLGMEKIKSVLGGEYNPLTSPYYTGLKEETARFEEKGISDIRQRSQLGGMLYSEPAMGAESEFRGILGTGLTKELGRLYESDVNRQASMIPQLLGYSGQEVGRQGMAMSGIAGLAPLAGKSGDIARQQALINQQIASQQAIGQFGVGTQQALGGFGVETQQALIDQQIAAQQALGQFGVGTQQALGQFGVGTQQALSDWQTATQQTLFPWTHQAPLQQYLSDWGTFYQPQMNYQPGPFDYLLGFAGALL